MLRTDAQFSNACNLFWEVKSETTPRKHVHMIARRAPSLTLTFRDITKSPRDKRSSRSINWTLESLGLDII